MIESGCILEESKALLPKVSIIITCFNYARYLEAAIKSVMAQTYENIECVIVDDCSSDGSYKLACTMLTTQNWPNFRVLRLGRNSGQMVAFRAGLENTDGRFVVFLDADDLLSPSFVETHVAVHLNCFRSAAMTGSDTITIDDQDRALEGTYFTFGILPHHEAPLSDIDPDDIPTIREGALHYGEKHDLKAKHRRPARGGWPYSATSSFMFRRDVLDLIVVREVDSIRICADWYLVQLANAMGGSILIRRRLGSYRSHSSNNFLGPSVLGGYRRTRMADCGSLFGSIDSLAEELVARDRAKLEKLVDPGFFSFFSATAPSKLKISLEAFWDRLPRPVQLAIMPVADLVDDWIK